MLEGRILNGELGVTWSFAVWVSFLTPVVSDEEFMKACEVEWGFSLLNLYYQGSLDSLKSE